MIYLAGVDQRDEQPAPQHASRFWLYAGANANSQEQAAEVLAATWSLRWFPLDEVLIEDSTALNAVA